MKMIWEWVAALLVVVGVTLMIHGIVDDELWKGIVGVVLLTIGVRLAIDCGKRGER